MRFRKATKEVQRRNSYASILQHTFPISVKRWKKNRAPGECKTLRGAQGGGYLSALQTVARKKRYDTNIYFFKKMYKKTKTMLEMLPASCRTQTGFLRYNCLGVKSFLPEILATAHSSSARHICRYLILESVMCTASGALLMIELQ